MQLRHQIRVLTKPLADGFASFGCGEVTLLRILWHFLSTYT